MKNEEQNIKKQEGNGVLQSVSGSNFILKVDDTFCEWEYGFTLNEKCIDDLIKAIEAKFKTKRNYSKMTRGAD